MTIEKIMGMVDAYADSVDVASHFSRKKYAESQFEVQSKIAESFRAEIEISIKQYWEQK